MNLLLIVGIVVLLSLIYGVLTYYPGKEKQHLPHLKKILKGKDSEKV